MPTEHLFHNALLIEDDPSHALLVKRALRDYVGEVTHCAALAEALTRLKTHTPELIITDLNLPDAAEGRHVAQLREASGDTPIVVLTASTSINDAIRAMSSGARDYIIKNFDEHFNENIRLKIGGLFSLLSLEQEKTKLQRELALLRIAIDNSDDGLAVIDAEGHVHYSNTSFGAFVRRCGGNSGDFLSFCSARVHEAEKLKSSIAQNLSALAEGAVWTTEIALEGDEDRAYHLSLSVIKGDAKPEGEARRECVVWLRDITELKRREQFQREILSTTTHDLKGPLGAIIFSIELLTELLEGNQRAGELVLRIGSAAQGAINLIDEFLSARRIQEGNFILRPREHKIGELIEEAVASYRTIGAARSISLETECGDSEQTIAVDKLGFIRVLGNLLSNAFKFTRRGGKIAVRASLIGDHLRLRVEDTGSGMEPSEIHRIFERFTRLERHAEVSGTGIGLFVVKSIVAAHGGKVEVTSKVGVGTTFEIWLPRRPPVNEHGELISLDFA